ncbi:hypothetical protein TNCV_2591771 [Trichonephila clavipes]|nr:hypothetical protein TNCV_2591771 [Trichonephila clavipes]
MSSNIHCSGLSRQRGQVSGRNYPPTNKNILIRALTEEWDKLPQQLLDNVVQTASPLVRLEEVEERWEVPGHLQGVLPHNWDVTEQNRAATCIVLKGKANDRRQDLGLRCEEFREP